MVWQAAILISSTFRGPSQNSVRDKNFPSSSERPSPCLIWNKLMKGITQRATAEGQISPTQDLRCGHEVFMNQQGHKSTIQEGMLKRRWGEEGGKNGRKQGAMTGCQTQTNAVLSTIRRSNTCRLFRNVRTLLAAPSKGITLRERAWSQTRATFQASSEHHTTPQDRQHTFLSKINTENKTRRKVNPPGSDTIPAEC